MTSTFIYSGGYTLTQISQITRATTEQPELREVILFNPPLSLLLDKEITGDKVLVLWPPLYLTNWMTCLWVRRSLAFTKDQCGSQPAQQVFLTLPSWEDLWSKGASPAPHFSLQSLATLEKGRKMCFIQLKNTYQASNTDVYKWTQNFAKRKIHPLYS